MGCQQVPTCEKPKEEGPPCNMSGYDVRTAKVAVHGVCEAISST